MTSSIRRQLVGIALASGLLTIVVAALGIVGVAGTMLLQDLKDLKSYVGADALEACAARPEAFLAGEGFIRVWAYDASGTAANPSAPPLLMVPSEVGRAHWFQRDTRMLPLLWNRAVIVRVGDGPCAILQAHTPQGRFLDALRMLTGLALLLTFVGLAVATVLGVARPLVARTGRLDRAAASIGTAEFTPVADTSDDELGRIGTTLDAAHDRILADRTALEQHLAAIAHDLRTPLASLQLTLEELSAEADVGTAQLEVAYLEALADNLHHAARLNAGGLRSDEVDLSEIARRVARRFQILGRSREVQIDAAIEDDVVVRGDVALVERAVANLVHNAVVHGDVGGQVAVLLDRRGEGAALTVVGGAGEVDVALLAARRLSNVRDAARSRSSSGLGVAIVNEIGEVSGWSVQWEADPEGGVRVELWIPSSAS